MSGFGTCFAERARPRRPASEATTVDGPAGEGPGAGATREWPESACWQRLIVPAFDLNLTRGPRRGRPHRPPVRQRRQLRRARRTRAQPRLPEPRPPAGPSRSGPHRSSAPHPTSPASSRPGTSTGTGTPTSSSAPPTRPGAASIWAPAAAPSRNARTPTFRGFPSASETRSPATWTATSISCSRTGDRATT